MTTVFKALSHWRSTKRKNRRQLEEQNVRASWIFGLVVWFLIAASMWFGDGPAAQIIREPADKDLRSIEIIGLKLERLMSEFDHRADLVIRLRTSENEKWSAENPLDRALYWLAVEDEGGRLTLQRYALGVLYFYTSQLESWGDCAQGSSTCPTTPVLATSTSECNWYGITCSPENVVTRVEWTSNNLSCSGSAWPEEILLLQELELLWLSDNPQLETSIPTFLGKFTNLQSLSLHHTKLQGSLPDSIYQLTNLVSLRVFETELTGSLSSEVGQLSNLSWLWLHGNRMTGQLPEELVDLKKLEGLTVHNNAFSNEAAPHGLCDLRSKGKLETYWTDCLSDNPPTCSCCSKCFVKEEVE